MNKIKTIVSIISIVLVLAMIAGLIGYLSGGFKNWNVKDWFGKENTETPDDNKGNDKTEIKERSVAFDLKFDTLDEENGYYTATLTKDQKAALLDYPNTFFFAELTGEYNGKEHSEQISTLSSSTFLVVPALNLAPHAQDTSTIL